MSKGKTGFVRGLLAFWLLIGLGACHAKSGRELTRRGDEMVVCGRYFHTGAPIVLWTDAGGYDAYRTEKRFVPWDRAPWSPPAPPSPDAKADGPTSPNRYNIRFTGKVGQPGCPLSSDDFERIRGGGWDLPTLQKCVDQFVLHYDVCGTSRQCFRVLHDMRGLSVHFMLDIDGTIYQTLDLKERAWHATTSNDRSIGIEIANIGAYPESQYPKVLGRWYTDDPVRGPIITLPASMGDGGVRTPGFVGHPARPEIISGRIQGERLWMYDLTPQQYDSLIKLTAALCTIFPEMPCDYPRDEAGNLVREKLPDDRLANYHGLLGHYHVQANKTDPGPALQWDRLISQARARVGQPPQPNP